MRTLCITCLQKTEKKKQSEEGHVGTRSFAKFLRSCKEPLGLAR